MRCTLLLGLPPDIVEAGPDGHLRITQKVGNHKLRVGTAADFDDRLFATEGCQIELHGMISLDGATTAATCGTTFQEDSCVFTNHSIEEQGKLAEVVVRPPGVSYRQLIERRMAGHSLRAPGATSVPVSTLRTSPTPHGHPYNHLPH